MPTTNGNTMTYSYDGHLDTFVVQTTGWYDIQAYGAQGGLVLGDPGSYGAAISGDFFLTSGETLDIIVGQQGFAGAGAGGGGGSFVFLPATPSAAASPLVVAGGGGGGSLGTLGGAGQAGTSGANGGASTGRGTGGTNGNGGGAGQSNGSSGPNENGGGGGGFLTAGAIGSAPASPSPANGGGGQAAVAGAAGGGGAAGAGNGGFGGGGGAAGHSGGGGGGYSGGGGGGSFLAGGGGGSFDASIVNNADLVLTTGGATAGGNGLVSFTQVSAPTAFRVGSTADLNAAIQAIDLTGSASALNTAYSITFTKGFTLTQQLYAINLASGDTLTIQGAGTTLDGAGAYNGLFVYAGTVTVQNLTIQNAKAIGGTGSGGGAGLGGGLFIASSGVVTLSNVSFSGDNATGGAANIGGGRGGGGLDGGAGVLGGGGVGLSATGGQVQVHSGGAGIILGAASGGVGWVAFDGFGGANGGGGGSGGHFTQDPLDSGGGGGGVAGGNGSGSTTGGTGGFGGGGGGGDDGGNGGSGGFGGGGGSGDYNGPTSGNGGAGGFGGGGGGTDSLGTGVGGTPGFGGGAAGPYYVSSGSGGLGAGGGIFVQQGGSLTYSGGGVSGGTVTGGSGGTGFDSGGDGSAFGAGLFLQGNQQATLSGPLTIADVIADQSGSGGTGDNAGAGSLLITGAGTVTLFAANTYVGGTTIAGGATFDLGNAKAAGGGAISFAASSSDTLKIESGDAPANVIAGFLPGDTIDLASVGLETTITPGAANAYSFSGGTGPNSAVTLHFNPMENFSGLLFNLAADGNGGTNVTLVVDQAPTVTNLPASQTLNDNQTLNPFANVTLADSDAGQTETITATLKANGVASDANGTLSGMGLMKTGAGTYQLNGSSGAGISALQLALRAAVFTPTGNEVAPGGKVATDVSIAISDGQQTNSAAGTLSVTSINDAPSIMFGAGGQITYDNSTIKPFDTVIVTDPDVGAQDSLTIRLTKAANGTLSGEGLSVGSSGIYTLAATSPATLTKELRALVFTPTANQVAPKDAVLTTFLLSAADGLGGTATNMNTSVLAISVNDAPTIAGTQASQATTDKGTATPFAMVTIADPDVGQTEAATVSFTAANGTLSNLGGGTVGAGSYTVSGTAAAVQMALRGLVFTPTANQVAPGHPVMTGFSLSVSDGTATTVDTHTSVVATSVNDAPTILGTQANQTTTDKVTATPFTMVAIADPDVGQTETATISYNAANGTLSNLGGGSGGGSAGAGAYTVSGTAAAVQVALRGLVFTPTANQVAPGQTVTTAFTLSVSDGIATTQNTTTSVAAASIIDAPVISGTKGGQTTTDYVPIKPFANVAVTDVDAVGPGTTDSVAIKVLSGGVATDATGKFSGGTGLTKTGTGTYTLTASSPQALTTALKALSFTPTQAQVKAGQTVSTMFQLTPSESAGGSVATGTADGTTSVTVTALNYVNGPANGFGLLTGTTGADVITAHGRFNAIFGLGGNDIVNAGDGNAAVTLGNGNASVTLGGAGNVVIGGNGNMSVTGAPGGFTTVTLGNGNDTVQIGGTNDVILLGNGTNMVSGTQGMAFITTGSGNDTITLGGSGNTVDAGAGQNTIFGGTGSDTFVLPAVGNGFDAISGFTETNGDVLDLRAALAATSWNHQSKTLANYLKVTDSDGSTNLAIAQTGSGSGTAIASLSGTNYGLTDLISHHSLLT